MKSKFREVPKKNYLVASTIVLAVVLLTFYLVKWGVVLTTKADRQSVLTGLVYELKYEELNDVFVETTTDYILILSDSNSNSNYNLEKKIKDLIVEENISNYIYYVNLNGKTDEKDIIDKINSKLDLKEDKITKLPAAIYYNDGEVKNIIEKTSGNNNFIDSLKDLLDNNLFK